MTQHWLETNLGIVSCPKACPCRERGLGLQVEEIEGFFTGAWHPGNGVAVSQREAQLHMNLKEDKMM